MNADPDVRRYLGPLLTPDEAAAAVLRFGFDELRLPEILAVATVTNARSQAVMRRIGMTTDPADDFDDPEFDGGPLRRCVLYRAIASPNGTTPKD